MRVRSTHRDYKLYEARDADWLLVEWPESEPEPTKYFLSTLPKNTSVRQLVRTVKIRWRIERDYEDLKQELGLTHYEGRGWRGFHHHATLTIASYAFLVAERGRFSPQELGTARRSSKRLEYLEVSDPVAPPIRPERHVQTSIASMRTRLIVALVRKLHRCPCCQQQVNAQGPTRRRTL